MSKVKKGLLISFVDMPLKNRLVTWWRFTLACLFKKDVSKAIEVPEVTLYDVENK